jgi:hypothetical protein
MYVVEYEHPDGTGAPVADGKPRLAADGSVPDARGRTSCAASWRRNLPAHRAGLGDQARSFATVEGSRQHRQQRRLGEAVPCAAGSEAARQRMGSRLHDVIEALEKQQRRHRRGVHRAQRGGLRSAPRRGCGPRSRSANIAIGQHEGDASADQRRRRRHHRQGTPHRQCRSQAGPSPCSARSLMLIGARIAAPSRRPSTRGCPKSDAALPPDMRGAPVLNRTALVDATIGTVAKGTSRRAPCSSSSSSS